MSLLWVVAGTFVAGVLSVWLAALLALRVMKGWVQHMLSLAAGALLATALTHLLPEALDSGVSSRALFGTILAALVFFFLLEKAELYHHGHDHGAPPGTADDDPAHDHAHGHAHAHAHAAAQPGRGGWALLLGDSVHTFCDGVLIAGAFMVDLRLGLAATLAVLAHEVPHHVSDFIVLRHSGFSPRRAVLWTSLAGAFTVVGGVTAYAVLGSDSPVLPYLLAVAASSFIYVALADLIPQLQQRMGARQTLAQVAWLGLGMALMMMVTHWLHGHAHGEHAHDHGGHAHEAGGAAAHGPGEAAPAHDHDHGHDHDHAHGHAHDHDHGPARGHAHD